MPEMRRTSRQVSAHSPPVVTSRRWETTPTVRGAVSFTLAADTNNRRGECDQMGIEIFKTRLEPRRAKRPPDSTVTLARDYNGTIDHLVVEAANVASAATRIVQMANQARHAAAANQSDVVLSVTQQILFLTGAMHRLMKDVGVVEHMQARGARTRRRPGDRQ